MEMFQSFSSIIYFGTGIPHARRTGFDRMAQDSGLLFSQEGRAICPREDFNTRYKRGSFCCFLNAFVYCKCSKIRTKFQPKFRWPNVKIRKAITFIDLDEQYLHVWFWIGLLNAFYNLSYCEISSDCTTVLPRSRDNAFTLKIHSVLST